MRSIRPVPAALLAAALALAAGCGDDPPSATPASNGSGDIPGVEIERVGPYDHLLADLDYPRPAPSGGSHTPAPYWLNCGVYDGAVPDELAVHSLEHGAIWIALGPDADDATRDLAARLAEGRKVIVSDVPDLPDDVEVVAWEHRLVPDGLDDPRVEQFIGRFLDSGTAPERGALCQQGLGEPPTPPSLPTP
jgi:hypothetical protein